MNLSPTPVQGFFDNNGRPLVGGRLFTYGAGTSIKVDTFTNSSGTLNTNPIDLDFRGECRLWIDPQQAYKFVLAPPGTDDPPTNPIWTVDNITAAPQAFDNASEDIGSVNNISLNIPQITSPALFTRVVFQAANTNTGATTIQINGGTALPLIFPNGSPMTGGEIQADGIYQAIFDGGSWQFQGQYYLQDYRDFIKAEYFLAGDVAPTAISRFYAVEEIEDHAHYAFLDDSIIQYAGGAPIYGHASVNSNVTIQGSVSSDHHSGFQDYPHINLTAATIARVSGLHSIGELLGGTVTEWSHVKIDDPIGVGGTITNHYGVFVSELLRGSGNNYAFFSLGQTKSCLGGDLQLGNPALPATVKYDYNSGNLWLVPRSTFKTSVQSILLIGAASEAQSASLESNGDLTIRARSGFNVVIPQGLTVQSPITFPSYTVAQLGSVVLPGDWPNAMVICSNETGGLVPAFSDGTNWRRVTDRNIVS